MQNTPKIIVFKCIRTCLWILPLVFPSLPHFPSLFYFLSFPLCCPLLAMRKCVHTHTLQCKNNNSYTPHGQLMDNQACVQLIYINIHKHITFISSKEKKNITQYTYQSSLHPLFGSSPKHNQTSPTSLQQQSELREIRFQDSKTLSSFYISKSPPWTRKLKGNQEELEEKEEQLWFSWGSVRATFLRRILR